MKLKLLRKFREDEHGGILAFLLIMFITLVIGGGMAVDFINSEYQREKIQDALDRGVLAAAAIGKAARAVTPTEIAAAEATSTLIVKSYLQKAGFNPEAPGVNITPTFTMNSQQVEATANYKVDTFFLKLSGINTLGGNTAAGALVTQNDIEISLVLDISGSMRNYQNGVTRIAALRTAGSNFVATMLNGTRSDYTLMSVIPFNHSVNMGASTLARFTNQMWHPYNGCVVFKGYTYNSTSIDPNSGLTQAGHALTGSNHDNNVTCTSQTALVYSNNIADLQAKIQGLSAGGATAGYIGMKWATGLLDPSSQHVVSDLIAEGTVPVGFAGRPAAYSDGNTLKFIVFMSDGQMNRAKEFIHSQYAKVYDSNGYKLPWNSIENANYWDAHKGQRPYYNNPYPRYSAPLLTACKTAKDAGIIVFSIAYGLTPGSSADRVLAHCASSLGHYYNVSTDNLNEAFASIAATVQRLRLIN